MHPDNFYYQTLQSPVGDLQLLAHDSALLAVAFNNNSAKVFERIVPPGVEPHHSCSPILELAQQQIREYFSGERKEFSLPIEMRGSDFQKRVWSSLLTVSYGDTWTYGEQAASLGQPRAARAVGTANGLNPLCIVVPCHRIVARGGHQGGYVAGPEVKATLLALESANKFGPIPVIYNTSVTHSLRS